MSNLSSFSRLKVMQHKRFCVVCIVPGLVFCLLFFVAGQIQAQIKIACVGNSITEGYGTKEKYVDLLNQKLGRGYQVGNYGVSGRTLLKKGDHPYWNEQKFREIFSLKPDIITIMLGTNDSKPQNWGSYSSEFSGDLQAMVDTFSTIESNPQIILVLPPHAGEGAYHIYGSIIHDSIVPIILSVAERNDLDVIDMNTPTLDKLNLMPDQVHPAEEGNRLMADVFYEGIINFTTEKKDIKILWYGSAPGALGTNAEDKPEMVVYPAPDSINDSVAIIVCPGGGYGGLAITYEGYEVAEWLNKQGITAFVLKYRYKPYKHPIPLMDARRAMRIVRYYASDYGIDTTKIGVLGFSAGGHLASTLLTYYDNGNPESEAPVERKKSTPDFGVLLYPVITLSGPYAHTGSRDNLLGASPSQTLIDSLSNQLRVTTSTSPTFLAHGDPDALVPVENSEMFDSALAANNVPHTLLVEPGKAHGYGLNGAWPDSCIQWLKEQQIVPGLVSINRKTDVLPSNQGVRKVFGKSLDGLHSNISNQIYFVTTPDKTGGPVRVYDSRGREILVDVNIP
ncbi:MAG: alpha/beta hydrolase fold domain-containing protein [Fibrobacteria bacterium]|nr:alpha/beta hydrolase fold domain-containing protein [Fibrobacteria bacterium]